MFDNITSLQALLVGLLVFLAVLATALGGENSKSKRAGPMLDTIRQNFSPKRDPVVPTDSAEQPRNVMSDDFNKRPVLNESELRLFNEMEKAIAEAGLDWHVLAQVRMGEFVGSQDRSAFFTINSERVDLLVTDRNGLPLHAIEYQGNGNQQVTATDHEAVKKEALRRAGVGYHEIAADDTITDLRAIVTKMKSSS
jgi:Protein of unknown function (DUF2726)